MYLISRNGYYHIEYFDQQMNRVRRRSTKTRNKSEALKYLSDFRNNLRQLKSSNRIITLQKFLEEYTQRNEHSATKDYQRSIKLSFKMLINNFGNIKLSSLSSREAEKFLLSTFSTSKYAAYLYYRTLKAAFNTALEWEYILSNPFLKIKLPKIPTRLPQFINFQDFNKILLKEKDPTLSDLYITTYYSGMRLGEIVNLKWSDIYDLDYLIVSNKTDFVTKSKKERRIPLNEIIKNILSRRSYSENVSEYIFINNLGSQLEKDYVSKHFKKCVKLFDSKSRFNFHTLRHSFASNLAQKGVSLYIIKELLGHSSITTTEKYAHLSNESLDKAIQLL